LSVRLFAGMRICQTCVPRMLQPSGTCSRFATQAIFHSWCSVCDYSCATVSLRDAVPNGSKRSIFRSLKRFNVTPSLAHLLIPKHTITYHTIPYHTIPYHITGGTTTAQSNQATETHVNSILIYPRSGLKVTTIALLTGWQVVVE
jgi:hypothetical protein